MFLTLHSALQNRLYLLSPRPKYTYTLWDAEAPFIFNYPVTDTQTDENLKSLAESILSMCVNLSRLRCLSGGGRSASRGPAADFPPVADASCGGVVGQQGAAGSR